MHRFTKLTRALALSAMLAATLSRARAQDATTGSISGTVTDSTGAVVKGATIVLTNTDRNHVERTLASSSAGTYSATSLPLGTYSVKVSDNGFKTSSVTGLVLHVGDALTVNRALTAGDSSQSITVTADQARVNLEDAGSSGLINSTQISEMPLSTRNYASLLNLQPGVAFGGGSDQVARGPIGVSGASSTVAFSINGGRTTSNGWTIDGADNLDRGANLTLYTYPSPDAIAEVKTLRGQYSAAYGRNSSGQIDVVTKSGTNQIHGSAYEYIRNNALDANGYANNFLGTKIAPYRYNDFGFSFGGPVFIPKIYNGRDKTFFFISEDFLREVIDNNAVTAIVPMASERNGDFTQSGYQDPTTKAWTTGPINVCTGYTTNTATQVNTCTGAGTKVTNISPAAQAYLKDLYTKIPLPQSSADLARNIDPHTLTSSFRNILNNLNQVIRVDQQFGERLSIFYRYLHDSFPETLGQGQFTTSALPGANVTDVKNPGTQHLAHGTYVFNKTLLMNVGYAFSNGNIVSTPRGYLGSAQSPDINIPLPYADTVALVPSISVSGMSALAGSVAYTDHGTNHQAFGDMTKVWRNHTFIAGFSYNHYQKLENNTTGTQGAFSFGVDTAFPIVPVSYGNASGVGETQAFANFLTGNANSGFSQLSRDPVTDIKSSLYEAFVQDNWKATPRLTLNVGVRYSYYGQPWDAMGQLSNFDPSKYSASAAPTIATTGLICFTGTCSQANSNAGQSTSPNTGADYAGINYINGMIFNGPSAANNNQASQFGNKVGSAQNANFAPRVGFAYDLFGDGRTAFRGGYGWSFDDAEVSYYETSVFNNPPAVATYSVSQTSFDSPAGGALTALSTTPGRIQSVPLHYQTPYVQQYSLDLQQEITPTLILDVGYFGDHGTHLLGALEINQPRAGAYVGKVAPQNSGSACIDPDTNTASFLNSTCDRVLNQIKPYIGYFAIDALKNVFSSNYNSLQVKVTKHFKGKSYIDANYTWSRDLTNAQADYSGFAQDIYNINADYGRAAVDRTNIISMDGVYELPWYREQKSLKGRLIGGWELSAIYAIDSGLPLTVSASSAYTPSYNLPGATTSVYNGRINTGYETDNAGLSLLGNTNAGLRPNMIGNPNAGNGIKIHNKAYLQSGQLWFYTGAFAAPSPNSIIPGTEKRGVIEGPGFNRLDLGVFRNFRIYNRLNFQFRAEAFNAANHTNVNTVSTAIGSATTFGEVTGYRDARILQFAGKFNF